MSDEEKIASGICISERGVDHCVKCVDRCDVDHFKRAIQELKDIAEDKKPDPNKE